MPRSAPLPLPQVVILAAGFSRRLGRCKASARVRGQPLLRTAVRLAAPFSAAPPFIVVPPRAVRLRALFAGGRTPCAGGAAPPCAGAGARRAVGSPRFIVNARRGEGLSSSVRAAVRRARFSAALLLLPVDLIELDRCDLARLLARWRGARRRVIARRLPADGGPAPGGTPLILPRHLYARAAALRGNEGLRRLIRELPPDRWSLVSLPSAAQDIDTPFDLARARRHRRGGSR